MDKYNVVYADPPWSYRDVGIRQSSKKKYSTLTTEDIKNLDISSICEDNSILYLWSTSPLLQEGLSVLSSWGFTYKCSIYWNKSNMFGMGHWYRNQVEILLMGIRGKVKPFRMAVRNIYSGGHTKHSRKPEYFRQLIEDSTKKIGFDKRIELFATQKADGWVSTGLDVDGKDVRDFLKMSQEGGKE